MTACAFDIYIRSPPLCLIAQPIALGCQLVNTSSERQGEDAYIHDGWMRFILYRSYHIVQSPTSSIWSATSSLALSDVKPPGGLVIPRS
jgi:hypothetical protein